MKIELFYKPGCGKYTALRAKLRATAELAGSGVEWHEINVLDSLDHAVDLGLLTLPSLAIDEELVFTSLPSPTQLDAELRRRLGHPNRIA